MKRQRQTLDSSDENHAVLTRIVEVLKQGRLQPTLHHSGGGTDANIFRAKGIEAFVVGCGFYNAHTTREYVVIDEMLQAAKFCEKLVTVV